MLSTKVKLVSVTEPSNADLLAKLVQHDAALAADAAELAHLSSRVDGISRTVDGHTALLRDLQDALVSHAADITEIRQTLGGHTARMDSIEATLADHTATLEAHTAMLADHGRRLTNHGDLLATILATVTRIEARVAEQ